MTLKLLASPRTPLLSLEEVKVYLRIQHRQEDALLSSLITLATQWIEDATGKTLLQKTWSYTHQNTWLILPKPPILDILEVRTKRRVLQPREYEIYDYRGSKCVEIPFVWERRTLTVTYQAGFGTSPDEIPLALHQAVPTTVAHLYENRFSDEKTVPFPRVQPWIQYHRTYQID